MLHLNLFSYVHNRRWTILQAFFQSTFIAFITVWWMFAMGSGKEEKFILLLTTNNSEYHDLSVLITRGGPGMPRRPWTQNGTRLSSTRTFIWSRYGTKWHLHTHTSIFALSGLCSYSMCFGPLWVKWMFLLLLGFCTHVLSPGMFSVPRILVQPLISTPETQVNSHRFCSYTVISTKSVIETL